MIILYKLNLVTEGFSKFPSNIYSILFGCKLSHAKIDESFANYFLKLKAKKKWFTVLKCKSKKL